ncbi:hypothetical protein CISIN_1g042392mg, partial [Citrus sinensis]
MGCCVSKSQRQRYPILGKPYEDVMLHYSFGRMLGRGRFGVTYLCTENSTNMPYACKSMAKKPKMKYAENDMMIRREIQIRRLLSGQPNIVELKSAHEDETAVHVVMELCQGGDLFDRIIAKGYYSERDAAPVLRAIVNAVNVCHSMGVMHRDLKPENFCFISRDDNALLKVTDFGSALLFEEEGGEASDDTSVILRMKQFRRMSKLKKLTVKVIVEYLPGEETQALKEKFIEMDTDKNGTLSYDELRAGLTKVGSMLTEFDVKQLMEAADMDGNGAIDYTEFTAATIQRQKLERSEYLSKAFQYFDKDNSGYDEFRAMVESPQTIRNVSHIYTDKAKKFGLGNTKQFRAMNMLKKLVLQGDIDGNGNIDFIEFVNLMTDIYKLETPELLEKAFQYLDKNSDQFITVNELETAFKENNMGDDATIKEIISEVGRDHK